MIDKYIQACRDLENLKRDFTASKQEEVKVLRQKDDCKEKLGLLESKKSTALEEEVRRERQKVIDSCSPLLDDMKKLKERENLVQQEYQSKIQEPDMTEFEEEYADELDILDEMNPTVDYLVQCIPDIEMINEFNVESSARYLEKQCSHIKSDGLCAPIKDMIRDYRRQADKQKESHLISRMQTGLTNILMWPASLNTSTIAKVAIYAGGVVGVVVAVTHLIPFAICAGAGGATYAVVQGKKKKANQANYEKLSNFLSMYDTVTDYVDSARVEYQENLVKALQEECNQKVRKLQAEYAKLDSRYKERTTNIQIDKNELARCVAERNKSVEDKYNAQLKFLDETLEKVREKIDVFTQRVREAFEICEQYKQAVLNTYQKLNQIGESKLFIKEFFLGFNDRGIISMAYIEKPINILYTSDESKENSDIINMMMAQILSTLSPAVIKMTVIDTAYSANAYAVYLREELAAMFKFITLEASIKPELISLYNDMMYRQKIISTTNSGIEEYNQTKINEDSLTMGYKVIFFQDISETILLSQEFNQLCEIGPRYGIIPIVFMNTKLVAGDGKKSPVEMAEKFKKYFRVVQDSSWILDADGGELQKTDEIKRLLED